MPTPTAQANVDDWNAQHPIGTRVLSYPTRDPRTGTPVETTTRSSAWLHAGLASVVLVTGKAGFVTLDSLEVLQAAEQPPSLSVLVNSLLAEWSGSARPSS